MERPIGVTVLGVLALVSGLWRVLKALVWFGVGGAVAGITFLAHPVAGTVVGGMALLFGTLALVMGIFSLIFAYGAFTLKPWARTLGVWTHGGILAWSLLAVMGPGMFSERWVDIAVSGVILYYLTRPEIKQAFGKG